MADALKIPFSRLNQNEESTFMSVDVISKLANVN